MYYLSQITFYFKIYLYNKQTAYLVRIDAIEFVTYRFTISILYFNRNYWKSDKDETITRFVWSFNFVVYLVWAQKVFKWFSWSFCFVPDRNTLGFSYRKKSSWRNLRLGEVCYLCLVKLISNERVLDIYVLCFEQ